MKGQEGEKIEEEGSREKRGEELWWGCFGPWLPMLLRVGNYNRLNKYVFNQYLLLSWEHEAGKWQGNEGGERVVKEVGQ